ncbi:NADH-quinone oxidoreductase subunit M, partial [Pseudomonas sp. BGM005]|nr:NADH-quinone oxidoreductase subunit M [Pseudomonas sp. BG5]
FLPLAGVVLLLLMNGDSEAGRKNVLGISLITTVFTFIVSLVIWIGFDNANPGFQMEQKFNWLGTGIGYHVGVDGISMLFVILSTFLMPFCVLASWLSIEKRLKEYMIAFLILETMMIGVFVSLDIV